MNFNEYIIVLNVVISKEKIKMTKNEKATVGKMKLKMH